MRPDLHFCPRGGNALSSDTSRGAAAIGSTVEANELRIDVANF